MSKTVICVVYVDDFLFWARSQYEIDNLMKSFKEYGPHNMGFFYFIFLVCYWGWVYRVMVRIFFNSFDRNFQMDFL